jgi:hypothetical protein
LVRAHDSGYLVLNSSYNGTAEIRGTTRSATRVLREVRGEFVGEDDLTLGSHLVESTDAHILLRRWMTVGPQSQFSVLVTEVGVHTLMGQVGQ